MGHLFAYSLAASVMLIPLYLAVRLMLQGLTFHRLYRSMLLGSLAVSLTAPFMVPSLHALIFAGKGVVEAEAPLAIGIAEAADTVSTAMPTTPLWLQIALLCYVTGVVVCLICQSVKVGRLALFISRCKAVGRVGKWQVMLHDSKDISSFSWGKYIVISSDDYSEGVEPVMLHERAHLEAGHWLDLLAVSFIGSLLWYNPALWLLRSDLSSIHEYEADSAVLEAGADARTYQIMLIKKAAGNRFHSIANSLDKSNISKRVKMMLKKRSMPVLRLRAAMAVPAAALALTALSTPVVANALGSVEESKVSNLSSNDQIDEVRVVKRQGETGPAKDVVYLEKGKVVRVIQRDEAPVPAATEQPQKPETPVKVSEPVSAVAVTPDDTNKVYSVADRHPVYEGGDAALLKFFSSNLRYPEEAFSNGEQGTVIVQFVVNKDCSISDVTVKRSVSELLDREAIRVANMLKFKTPGYVDDKPVAVWYVLPVRFRLSDNNSAKTDSVKTN